MRKRPKHASTPIDNEQDHEISDSQKKHFTQLGYKPYLSYRGKIKWLSYEQHIYEKIKYAHRKKPFSPIAPPTRRYRRAKWHQLVIRFIHTNWLLLSLLLVCLLVLKFYNEIISFFQMILR